MQAVAIAGLVHIELDVAYVRGDTTPDGAVTVTVLDRNGNETNRWQTTATDSGQFGVRLVKSGAEKDGAVMTLDPGTVMGVDLTGSGDPMLFVVPELTALADIDREEIVGTAPPGHRVAVEVRGTSQVIARSVPAQVEAGGRYVSSLTGVHDVEPGSVGRLTATRPDGHQWSVSWAAPRTTLDLAGGSLSVTASTNQSVRLRLLDPHGVERGTAAWRMRLTTSFNRIVTGIAPFSDRFGRTVVAVPGDTVEGRIGTGSVQFRVLRLEAAASVADDAIQGSTDAPPGSSLRMAAIDVGAASIVRTLIVPADGAFVFDLTRPSDPEGPFDLRFNTTVSLRLDHRAHRFLLDVTVPGLNLGLSGPRLSGTLAPRAEGVVNWLRGGRSLARNHAIRR